MAKAKNTIRIDFVFGTLIGHKEFDTQETATKFCEWLYKKKLDSAGLKFSDVYEPATKNTWGYTTYGGHRIKCKNFSDLKDFPLKVTILHI